MTPDDRALLRALFDAAVAAALPARLMGGLAPDRPRGRLVVVGGGKAAAAMAAAAEDAWGALEGLVVTRYDHAVPTRSVEVVEAAHPVPDAAGAAGAARLLEIAASLGEDDLMVALMSGGASSLLTLPAAGVSLADKQAVNRDLLACGATIDEINAVRKHLSAIKGGRLAAAAWPARCVTLAISDVPGDDLSVIGSGPTVGDATTLADARAVLEKYRLTPPAAVTAALNDPANETPAPGDSRLSRAEARLIATPQMSIEAAAEVARAAGVTPVILGDAIEGEAREVGRAMAGIALQIARRGQPAPAPCVLISGGETTVTLGPEANGRGGRNVEFLMGLADGLNGAAGICAIACDTDGVDGAAEVAGAMIGPDTLSRATAPTLAEAMRRHDGHGFFAALGDQVITGPTLTNVNDFRAILIRPEGG